MNVIAELLEPSVVLESAPTLPHNRIPSLTPANLSYDHYRKAEQILRGMKFFPSEAGKCFEGDGNCRSLSPDAAADLIRDRAPDASALALTVLQHKNLSNSQMPTGFRLRWQRND